MQKKLQRLQETTFVNELFKISAVDEVATIGGLRLGRTQRIDIGWDEINAALGQVVYLLCVLAHRMGYSFEKHSLHVNGAFSKISLQSQKNMKYELYYVNNESSFNKGMTLLLECVGSFMAHVQPGQSDLLQGEKIKKCAIVGDKIDSSSIIYKADNKEQWTRACKCLLTNLQYLCIVSKMRDEQGQKQAHILDPVYAQNVKK